MKCSMCNSVLSNSNLKFSCSHFLCNKCLSRKLLLLKLSPLSKTREVEMNCDCGGTISVPYSTCLNNISASEVQKKKNKYCKKHNAISDTYCPICRLWLCSECISSFHYEYFKNNHKLCQEDKMITSKCFYHRENINDFFCKTCNKLICRKCITDTSNSENLHNNHAIFSLDEYHKLIKNKRKNLKYKSFNDIMKFIDKREIEITKDFGDKCNESKEYIEEAIKKLEELKEKYITKYHQQLTNLKNIFLIIKQSYNNFYKELDGDKIDLASFDFISKIEEELNNISYTPMNFDLIENIHKSLNKINSSLYYKIKFNFRKIFYEKEQSIDMSEGITAICPLRSIPKSFACGTINGRIIIYSKDEYEYSSQMKEDKLYNRNNDKRSINILIEVKKSDDYYLLSGSNDKTIRIYSIENYKNTNEKGIHISCKKELYSEGIILSLIELNDGRIASSYSDNKIKIWDISNKDEIKIDAGFENCLIEASIKNDEINKQLISGSINGMLKSWDISSGKPGKTFECQCSIICCMVNINYHTLAVGDKNGQIIIIDLLNERNQKFLSGHKRDINSICYSKYKDILFSCSKDMTIKIWDLETLKCINTLYNQHNSMIYGIILCGNDLISCSNDCSINIYSTGEDNNDINNDSNNYDEENYDKFE